MCLRLELDELSELGRPSSKYTVVQALNKAVSAVRSACRYVRVPESISDVDSDETVLSAAGLPKCYLL